MNNPNFKRADDYKIPPPQLINLYETCRDMIKAGNLPAAEQLCIELLNHDYNDPNAMFLLATAYQKMDKEGLGVLLLRAAANFMPKTPSIYNNMGACFHTGVFNGEALQAYEMANTLSGGKDADILGNIGGMFINVGDPASGLEWMDKSLEIEPEQPNCNWNKSLLLLELERWEEGFNKYEYGLKTGDRKYKPYFSKGKMIPEWDGSPVNNLIVCGEQGIGDEIMFASMLTDVLETDVRHILLDCHPRLSELFEHHVLAGRMTIEPGRKTHETAWIDEYNPDARVNIGSLGKFFRNSNIAFEIARNRGPYINLPQKDIAKAREALAFGDDSRLKVGIAWEGGNKRTRRDLRSIALTKWLPLLATEGVDFICLQYKVGESNITGFNQEHGVDLHYIGEDDDFYSHACAVAACDLVISICQTDIHLCGAIGQECWCLTPNAAAWRYGLTKPYMAWYNSVKLIRQSEPGRWSDVMVRVQQMLEDKVTTHAHI